MLVPHEHLFQAAIAFQVIPAENPGIDSRDRGDLPAGAAGRKRPDQDRAVGIGAYEVLPVVRESALQRFRQVVADYFDALPMTPLFPEYHSVDELPEKDVSVRGVCGQDDPVSRKET